ncbi:MAG: regulatory signaling modulator protein AmpE [Gammaproteobacteria bacterium]
MTLFAVLICLALQYYFDLSSAMRDIWCIAYAQNGLEVLKKWQISKISIILGLLLLPILIAIGLINLLLTDILFDSVKFIFNVLILFYCLDGRHLSELPKEITRIFFRAEHYLFSVIFWYVVLGPVGAVGYAFINSLAHSTTEFVGAAVRVRAWLDWIPARLIAFTYALVGHFGQAFTYLRQHFLEDPYTSMELSHQTGQAALGLTPQQALSVEGEESRQALDLVHKAVILWLVVLAVFTLIAWVA